MKTAMRCLMLALLLLPSMAVRADSLLLTVRDAGAQTDLDSIYRAFNFDDATDGVQYLTTGPYNIIYGWGTTDHIYGGTGKSLRYNIIKGCHGDLLSDLGAACHWNGVDSKWGETIYYCDPCRVGDEVWLAADVYFPDAADPQPEFDFSTDAGHLKFMRITGTESFKNDLYIDFYDNRTRFIYEGHGFWTDFPVNVSRGEWQRWEMYVRMDDSRCGASGQGKVKVWKDGAEVLEVRRKTLTNTEVDTSTNISFSGNTITCSSGCNFGNITDGEDLEIYNSASNDGCYTANGDATTTTITVDQTLTTESAGQNVSVFGEGRADNTIYTRTDGSNGRMLFHSYWNGGDGNGTGTHPVQDQKQYMDNFFMAVQNDTQDDRPHLAKDTDGDYFIGTACCGTR